MILSKSKVKVSHQSQDFSASDTMGCNGARCKNRSTWTDKSEPRWRFERSKCDAFRRSTRDAFRRRLVSTIPPRVFAVFLSTLSFSVASKVASSLSSLSSFAFSPLSLLVSSISCPVFASALPPFQLSFCFRCCSSFSVSSLSSFYPNSWPDRCWRSRRPDRSGLRQRVLAAGRRDPEPERVQDFGRTFEVGGALAQRKVWDHVRCGDKVT